MMHPQPQELNAPMLALVRARGVVRDDDIHLSLALSFAIHGASAGVPVSPSVWRFSAVVNLAKRRLLRYGLLRRVDDRCVGITPLGELFLAKGMSRLDPHARRSFLGRGSRMKIA